MFIKLFSKVLLIVLILTAISGCGGRGAYKPVVYEQDDEWIRMVSDYRREAARNPGDHENKSALKRAELDAAEHFYRQAMELKKAGKTAEAIASLQKGLAVMRDNEKISSALADLMLENESQNLAKEAMVMKGAGNFGEAQKLLKKAAELNPMDERITKELDAIAVELNKPSDDLFKSENKITLKFNGADLKTVFDFLASSYGINVIYDEGAKSLPVNIAADNVTLQQALDTLMTTHPIFYKKIGSTTLLVAQDTKAKRDQYDDLIIRTFQLNSVKASDMSMILKNSINLKRVTVNELLNSISVRDTEDILKLVDKVVRVNDRKPAEVIFDVEIMEVNRTKSEQLGLNYGSQIKLSLPVATNVEGYLAHTFLDTIKQGALTLPAFTLNFFKQDVDAKMLANPSVRVLDGKTAKIHIGDRVPLRSSTIQDASGQIRYSYDYKDIGVMLEVTPKINLDNTVSVLLKLEVSSLGSNIGTTTDPAYSIGTRDAQTTMLLRDGETAILGGLIRDEDRTNKMKLPILGDIPLIGSFFATSTEDNGSRTDVLLTITPKVVRTWEHLGGELRDIYSGTENNLTSESKYKVNADKPNVKTIKIDEKAAEKTGEVAVGSRVTVDTVDSPAGVSAAAMTMEKETVLSFSEPQYILQKGQDGIVKVLCENPGKIALLPLKIAFNPDNAKFVSASVSSPEAVSEFTVTDAKAGEGMVEMGMSLNSSKMAEGKMELVSLKFTALKQGASYLVFLDNKIIDSEGLTLNVQRTASRLVVK